MKQLLIESGSTKSEWVLFDEKANVLSRQIGPGWNPQLGLESNEVIPECKEMISKAEVVHFYSAGISSQLTKQRVVEKLEAACLVHVYSDLEGACKATLGDNQGIVGILGTGSNASYWDGKEVHMAVPSLGYMLSDEGGGVDLGKELIASYFFKEMPEDLRAKFFADYAIEKAEVLENIYQKPYPNRYLADYSRFISNHVHPWTQSLLKERLTLYINRHVVPNFHKKNENIAFVGSVAFVFQDILIEICTEFNLKVVKVLKTATEGLIEYHTKQTHE